MSLATKWPIMDRIHWHFLPTAVTVGFQSLGLGLARCFTLSPKTGTAPWNLGTLEPLQLLGCKAGLIFQHGNHVPQSYMANDRYTATYNFLAATCTYLCIRLW